MAHSMAWFWFEAVIDAAYAAELWSKRFLERTGYTPLVCIVNICMDRYGIARSSAWSWE